jgi:apolipoprotein D and lipocalin family protein
MKKPLLAAFTAIAIILPNSFIGEAFWQESSQNARSSDTLQTVPSVDLKRYVGVWHEIALFPNRFQAQCIANTTATYRLQENGRIEVTNRCSTADGKSDNAIGEAKLADANNTTKLKVRFAPWYLSWLPQVWGDYWVIDLDADYRYAVVSEPSKKFLWVLSRTPVLPAESLAGIKSRLTAKGFDVTKLQMTPQTAQSEKDEKNAK